ncbi:MAG: xanthine dehydrogenase family protein [Candidatus Cloacimonetes bacterium]|nr:xanthine dehydrogenase family protein [Candidatus Cloacimonadota bacterium]
MKNIRKIDARPKITGTLKFTDDYKYPDILHGCFLYANFDHGNLKKIIYPSGFDPNDFIIVGASDIPGSNIVPEPEPDQPFLVDSEVMHYGQIILGIAHPDRSYLRNFCRQIKLDFQPLPAIIDVKECLDDLANKFGRQLILDNRTGTEPDDNLLRTHGIYYTPHQEQAYLETQGMIAWFEEEQKIMHILGTMQCPFFVKEAVESLMGDAASDVIVRTAEGIGGAFGGKEDFPNIIAGVAALLAYKSKKRVKIILDREDDILITTKRHPSRIEIETYADKITGKIHKMEIDYRLDAGAYQTLSPVVLSRGVLHAFGAYEINECYVRGSLLRSNTPSNGAFRGFGAPQAFFAVESHLDRMAAQLNKDPVELRKINLLKQGSRMPTSQLINDNNLAECFDRVLKNSDYRNKVASFAEFNKTHKDKKGIGVSVCFHGGGYTGNGEKILKSKVKITLYRDGLVKVFVANTDMGQGAHTTLAQIVSEELDHPLGKTTVQIPDTSLTPNSGPTVASRTIYIVGTLLQKLSRKIKTELKFTNLEQFISENQDIFPKSFEFEFEPDPSVEFNDQTYQGTGYKDYSWAACVCELYFNALTYKTDLTRIWNVIDIGRPVNRKIAEGQVEGGVVQAMGYALTEFGYKKDQGRMRGFTDYTLPSTYDIPIIEIEFINQESTLAKGLGEIPMDYPAPAIRNAFFNATGVFLDEIPLTPERIRKKLSEQIGDSSRKIY